MNRDDKKRIITRDRFDAVLFDLDGVLTATAKVHATCWKRMFDAFLEQWAETSDEPFRPFDIATDYKLYVDGRLRYDGAQAFLESRGIHLPHGNPTDPPSHETICGLGNQKDELLFSVLESEGVEVYKGGVALARHLRNQGFSTAVVSASKSCAAVLEAGGISDLFDARIDGEVAERLELPGKPAPDMFLKAAGLLGVSPDRAVVVEDAISGVEAGRNGGFGLVIGVDHTGNEEALRQHGAHIVVQDLGELLD
jgi:beta-phosphoglucomutase family hydrolase